MTDRVRKGLVWDIRKRLLNLSAVELFQVAKSIGPIPERDFSELDAEDQEGCLEFINAFMYSTHLGEVSGLDINSSTIPTVRHSDFEELSRKLLQYLSPHTQHPTPSSPDIMWQMMKNNNR